MVDREIGSMPCLVRCQCAAGDLAQDFLAEFPVIDGSIDIDGDGIACEDWFPE